MQHVAIRRIIALAVPLALAACDGADWSTHGGVSGVSNAANGQPVPQSAFPRGASDYGNPPNAMVLPKLGTR